MRNIIYAAAATAALALVPALPGQAPASWFSQALHRFLDNGYNPGVPAYGYYGPAYGAPAYGYEPMYGDYDDYYGPTYNVVPAPAYGYYDVPPYVPYRPYWYGHGYGHHRDEHHWYGRAEHTYHGGYEFHHHH